MEVLVILPAAILMGMSFPIAANLCRNESESGSFVGKLYTFNTIGALLGPIAAAFLLIPQFGSGPSILVIVGLNVFIGLLLILTSAAEATKTIKGAAFALVAVSLLAILSLKYFKPNFFYPKTLKHQLRVLEQRGIPYRYLEDSTASVLAYMSKDRQQHDLIIDGVGITNLVGETKLMAHLPLLINPEAKSLLAICFGMGTTFRSALTYDISVDAAELVPSVPKVFPMFFMDGSEVLANPKGKIIINDGRNHVFLTKRKYDVITVDPPPPLNSAGTTVLYSQEFYNQAKRVLTPNGLFVQWIFFGSRQEDIKMIMQSFLREFPFVYAFSSPIKIGYFFIGSQHELNFDEKSFARKLEQTPKAMSDLNEWNKMDAGYLMSLYYGDKAALEKIVGDSEAVTDDSPRTEYFFLRHRLSQGQ
jgi:spermidine synthase